MKSTYKYIDFHKVGEKKEKKNRKLSSIFSLVFFLLFTAMYGFSKISEKIKIQAKSFLDLSSRTQDLDEIKNLARSRREFIVM